MRNLFVLPIVLLLAPGASAGLVNGNANLVLGQVNFANIANNFVDNIGMAQPAYVAIDTTSHRLFVSDSSNNRVLVWNEISGFTNGQMADAVLGQPDIFSFFPNQSYNSSSGSGIGPATLNTPGGLAVDSSGSLWVADTQNERVVRYSPPFMTGMSANLVLGEPDLSTYRLGPPIKNGVFDAGAAILNAVGLAFDPAGNLWVSDNGASRVVGFAPPFSNYQDPFVVLGQVDFGNEMSHPQPNQGAVLPSTYTLAFPLGIAVDASSHVWVADQGNNRVVRFTISSSSENIPEDIVLGQPDFVSCSANQTFNDASTCTGPVGVPPPPPPPTPPASIRVPFGPTAASLSSSWVPSRPATTPAAKAPLARPAAKPTASRGRIKPAGGPGGPSPIGAYTLLAPIDVELDPSGNVWVSDNGNARVLGYAAGSLVIDSSASYVIGQGDFTDGTPPAGVTVSEPAGMRFDASGNLWLADTGDSRVLQFASSSLSTSSPGPSASMVLGQINFTNIDANFVDNKGMSNPSLIVSNPAASVLAAVDSGNDRILWWNSSASLATGQPAAGVLGQPDINSYRSPGTPMPTATAVGGISGAAVDAGGNVWVTDSINQRVLRFPAPLMTGEPADIVLGQPNAVSNSAGGFFSISTNTFNEPEGLAFDAAGHLWVADWGNNRVLRFTPPFATFMNADLVLGQSDFVSNQSNKGAAAAANTLSGPSAISFDAFGNVWVADEENLRILGYLTPFSNGEAANAVLGQANLISNSFNPQSANSVSFNVTSIAVDTTTGNLWAADSGFERVIRFPFPLTNGKSADFVLGQPDLVTGNINGSNGVPSASGLSQPTGVTIDGLGNLWVGDSSNNRVLGFGPVAAANGLVSPTTPTTTSWVFPIGTFLASIPGGAFNQLCQVFLSTAANLPIVVPPGLVPSQVSFDIRNSLGLQPSKPIIVTFTYSPSAIAGLDPSKLVVAYFNPATGQWVNQPTVDSPGTHSVTVTLLHFSHYALFQQLSSPDLSAVYVYPDPYRLNSGGAYGDSVLGHGVVFANLTLQARIRVFTLSGDLVADFTNGAGTGKALWNIQNNKGETVASGIYIYLVTNPNDSSQKATGRFAIIK